MKRIDIEENKKRLSGLAGIRDETPENKILFTRIQFQMTNAGNLTINVYQLLNRNPHVPAILALTKGDNIMCFCSYFS